MEKAILTSRRKVFFISCAFVTLLLLMFQPFSAVGQKMMSTNEAQFATMDSSVSALPQGVIAMIGRNRPIPQGILDHPYVTGVLIRNWWPDTEPEEGVFDWSYFDEVIPKIEAAGKWIWLVIESGGERNTPQWVFDAGIEAFTFIDSREPGTVKTTPVWWDPVFREKKTNFIKAMGEHFASNPNIISISAHDLNANTDDFRIPRSSTDVQNWQAIGYTPEKMIDALKETIDVTMAAFPNRFIRTPIGRGSASLDPDANFIAREVISYAKTTYPGRFFFQRHGLSAAVPDPDVDQELFIWQLYLGFPPDVGAEMVWSVSNDPDCRMNGGVSPCDDDAAILREAVRLGKRYGTQYQEIFAIDILNADLQQVIRFAQDLLTIPTTPTELTATSVSSAEIELDWVESTDPVAVTGYTVYRDGVEIATIPAPPYLDEDLQPDSTYTYEVSAMDAEGNESERSSPLQVTTPAGDPTSVTDKNQAPTEFVLQQNYPNPFNPSTQVRYDLPNTALVELKIYDLLGREVKTLVNQTQDPGSQSVTWDGRDNAGRAVSSGLYVYRIRAGGFTQSRKMLLLR